jgi:hypothetical protein
MQLVLLSLALGAALPILSTGFANADFLEDVSSIPTEKSINDILEYCDSNPNGNITSDLVNTKEISEFYTDYSCEQAAQDKAWLDNDANPDSDATNDQ